MLIEILKPHKILTVGQVLNIDIEYSANLIKKGIAKSLEVGEVVEEKPTTKAKTKK